MNLCDWCGQKDHLRRMIDIYGIPFGSGPCLCSTCEKLLASDEIEMEEADDDPPHHRHTAIAPLSRTAHILEMMIPRLLD